MGHTIPKTGTNSSSETGPRAFWLKYWSSVMSFPYDATVLLVPAHRMQKHTAVVEQELVPGVLLCPQQQGQQAVPIHDPDGEDQSHQTDLDF